MIENDLEGRRPERQIHIPNAATYWPVAPTDVVIGAPLAARLLFGATPLGSLVHGAAIGAYLSSALQDWLARLDIQKIDFYREFGADLRRLKVMSHAQREEEARVLVERLNDEYTTERLPRRELAVEVDRHLTSYIASITGQHVNTSTEVRNFSVAALIFPFAIGACDMLSGDVAVFRDLDVFEPHIIAHEFSHRKGYWRELEAQALSYLSLTSSGEPLMVQSALCERLHRHWRVLVKHDVREFEERVTRSDLRIELRTQFLKLDERSDRGAADGDLEKLMRNLYEARMRLTGQNGLSDYDVGFTNFLFTFERSARARQSFPAAGAL
jgi:hypothetical protein